MSYASILSPADYAYVNGDGTPKTAGAALLSGTGSHGIKNGEQLLRAVDRDRGR